MNPQLDLKHPGHLRQHETVRAWISSFQHASGGAYTYPDCQRCGWPHSPSAACGLGSSFGRLSLGGRVYYVCAGTVEWFVSFVEALPALGFHWRDEWFVRRDGSDVVLSAVEGDNGRLPVVRTRRIPVSEFASVMCAAAGGETVDRYQDAVRFLAAPREGR